MAALEPAAPRNAGSKPRARKHSFRLDMTPMVDLAFLLLTFFMLTTSFAQPRVMQLNMPVKDGEASTPVPASRALTILLGPEHRVYYYFGLNSPADPTVPVPLLHRTDLSAHGLRQVLLARHQRQPAPIVLIATAPGTNYQDMVSVLDEMKITDQLQYALIDLRPADRQLLADHATR